MNKHKVFPISSSTACLLKWTWSTVFLSLGRTSSCHRCDHDTVTVDNFQDFHNTPNKLQARELMREGHWPQRGCQYCEKIESAGGTSDRQYQLLSGRDQDATPVELLIDPTANRVTPAILEIYFTNTCNMACLYCGSHFSSVWEAENRRHGNFHQGSIHLVANDGRRTDNYPAMLAEFWRWLEQNYSKLRFLQIAGGEPFYQDELEQCVDFFETHSNPNIVINLISNLKVSPAKLERLVTRLEQMKHQGKISGLQISASLDCWGPQQEFVRWGLDLQEYSRNMEYLMTTETTVVINGAISALTIKTMPDYIEKMKEWSAIRTRRGWSHLPIHYSFMTVTDPVYMRPDIFPADVFDQDFERIISAMPNDCEQHINDQNHMQGIRQQIAATPANPLAINELKIYLDEISRRRGADWKPLFPWLANLE